MERVTQKPAEQIHLEQIYGCLILIVLLTQFEHPEDSLGQNKLPVCEEDF